MKEKLKYLLSTLMWMAVLLTAYAVTAQTPSGSKKNSPPAEEAKKGANPAAGPNQPVQGNGTLDRLTKWTGVNGSGWFIGDSIITETKQGNIGVGTTAPTSKMTVAGMIETTSGGLKFPDGTVQTTAGAGSQCAAQNAFHASVQAEFTEGGNEAIGTIPIPAGKRLVIEYMTIFVSVQQGQKVSTVFLLSVVAGVPASHAIRLSELEFSNVSSSDGVVKIYADPSPVDLRIQVVRNALNGSGLVLVSVSGYLVNLP